MRQVIGGQLGDFAAIYDEDVEVISVTRPQASTCEALAKRLIRSRQIPQLRWIQPADDPEAPVSELPATIDPDVHSALLDQIAGASEMLGELMDCERVGVRLETLNAPMCPRFHVDHVPYRMLITLSGVDSQQRRRLGCFRRSRNHGTPRPSEPADPALRHWQLVATEGWRVARRL